MIPKIVWQTWRRHALPKNVELIRQSQVNENPDYTFVLYDDDDVDNFISENFEHYIHQSYVQLKAGPAKADFFRYCALYLHGGVYLDIDSGLTTKLSDFISQDHNALVSRETNPSIFLQWMLVFDKRSEIMKKCIEICCFNINHRMTEDIFWLTGPGVYTTAVNQVISRYVGFHIPYFLPDEIVNKTLVNKMQIPITFFGKDFCGHAVFKHKASSELYQSNDHWQKLLSRGESPFSTYGPSTAVYATNQILRSEHAS